jgi:stress-induced-phosphoprotein 1
MGAEADGDGHASAEAVSALYSNRSAAHASLGQAILALEDAEQVVALRPDWAKGWSRKGAALHLAGKWASAAEAYSQGLELEPESAALRQGLEDAEKAFGEMSDEAQ